MKVKDIMVKNVKVASTKDNIKNIVILICTNHFSGVPVMDSKDNVVGIISEKDILKAMYPNYLEFYEDPSRARDFDETEERYNDLLLFKVEDLMTREIWTVPSDTHILKAASLMVLKRIRRLPVVDNGKLVGIVSQGDIHQAIFKSKLIR